MPRVACALFLRTGDATAAVSCGNPKKGIFVMNLNITPDREIIQNNIEAKLARHFGCTAQEATREQVYKAAAMTIKEILMEKRSQFAKRVNRDGAKRVYYMCMEFLLGRSMKTNLCNLGLDKEYAAALAQLGFDLEDLYE